MRVAPLRTGATALIAVTLAACGGEDRAIPVVPGPGPGPGASAGARLGTPAITDGRLGEATTGRRGRPDRVLDRGGRFSQGGGAPRPGAREGVSGAANCGDIDQQPAAASVELTTTATVCLLNAERTARGLAALTVDEALGKAAVGFSRAMVSGSFFGHESPDGRGPADRIRAAGYLAEDAAWTIGENLAWGSGALSTPRAIVKAWMESAGHRDNILKPSYREVGVGVALGVPKAGVSGGATYTTTFGALTRAGGDTGTVPVARTTRTTTATTSRARTRRRLSRVARLRAARLRAARARTSGAR